MSDFDGGAPAPSEGPSAPIEQVTHTPEPVSTEREPAPKPEPKAEEPAKPVSTREALAKARETVEKREAKVEKPDDKAAPVKDSGPNRSEDGKFAAKEGQEKPAEAKPAQTQAQPQKAAPEPSQSPQRYEAPARFSAEAKTAWETAPDSVKAETHRALTELQNGFEKHKEAAQSYESVRKYGQMARESGTTLHEALDRYVSAENMLRQDPIRGLDQLCQQMGTSLRQIAAHVLNQSPDQQASQSEQTVRELRQELSGLKQQLGGVTGHLQSQQQQATISEIEVFAAKPENKRFDELSDTIATLLSKGVANNLSEAYSMADRLNPAAAPVSDPAPAAPAIDLTPQTQKGSKSISGAPSAGSDPATSKQPSSSIKEALKRAAARAG